ncbi:MAG: hypothetical protein ACO1NW_07685 [Chitinophagaceae bacterium]
MDHLFTEETKALVAGARNTAIELGYDYICSLDFLVADCASGRPDALLNFGFPDKEAFEKYKAALLTENAPRADLKHKSLPLTLEAERMLRAGHAERKARNHALLHPCHIFLAGLKSPGCMLREAFTPDDELMVRLEQFYHDTGAFQKCDTAALPPVKRNWLKRTINRLVR